MQEKSPSHTPSLISGGISQVVHSNGVGLDCKKVRIFAYSSTRQQSNKMSGARLRTESETLKLN